VLTLLLPQAAQAHGGPQLPRPGLLVAGNGEGLLETFFCLRRVRDGLLQQEFALNAMHLWFVGTLSGFLPGCRHLGQYGEPLFSPAYFPKRFGQQGNKIKLMRCPSNL
jgi:hypothetical protein